MASVPEVNLVQLKRHTDARGSLFALEKYDPIPFEPRRVFVLCGLDDGTERACHAVSCEEFVVPLSGHCSMEVRSKTDRQVHRLTAMDVGVHVPAGIWMRLFDFGRDFRAMVICSERYGDTSYFDEPQV